MISKFRQAGLILFLLMIFSICAGENLWAEQYYYYDLGTSSGFTSTYAYAINDSGNIAGTALTDSSSARAFLWTPSSGMQNLGTIFPGYGYSMGSDVNNLNHVVGISSTLNTANAFRWTSSGGMQDLGTFTIPGYTLGGSYSNSINNNGFVVGSSYISRTSGHAFLWNSTDGMKDLGALGGVSNCYSAANVIDHRV